MSSPFAACGKGERGELLVDPEFSSPESIFASSSPKNKMFDPLLQAVERGSNALDFIKAPLVRDYVHRTFMSTLPSILTQRPLHEEVIPGFSTYHSGDLPVGDIISPCRWTNLLRQDTKERIS